MTPCALCGRTALYCQGNKGIGYVYACRDHVRLVNTAYKVECFQREQDRARFGRPEPVPNARNGHVYQVSLRHAPRGYQRRA